VFGSSDIGVVRDHNEDAFAIFDARNGRQEQMRDVVTLSAPPEGLLFMVADGMGGAAAGEIASRMAVDAVEEVLAEFWRDPAHHTTEEETFADSLRRATNAANSRIHGYAAENSENRGMGTTATIAALRGDTLYLAQVGDSRAYLARAGSVFQLTRDQSLMQRLVDAGELTPEEAEASERRNIILQALGPEATIHPDISYQQLRSGDLLILCSDGLSGQVKVTDMARIIEQHNNPQSICSALISLANERGGPDNITAIVARFSGPELRSPDGVGQVGYQSYAPPGGEPWRFTPTDGSESGPLFQESWFETAASREAHGAGPAPSREYAASRMNKEPVKSDFSRAVLFGILAAVAAGVAMILYTHLS
jgi:protein phosphatase